jgi:hypothetical protein
MPFDLKFRTLKLGQKAVGESAHTSPPSPPVLHRRTTRRRRGAVQPLRTRTCGGTTRAHAQHSRTQQLCVLGDGDLSNF